MGTRCLTNVLSENGKILVTIYRQMDGYPGGHGVDLLNFLKDRDIVNGIGSDTSSKSSNGMGCLAASLVEYLKNGQIGNIYMVEPGSKGHWEEYQYDIWAQGQTLYLKVQSVSGGFPAMGTLPAKRRRLFKIYDGPVSGFQP